MTLLINLSFLASCGYRWVPDYPDTARPTVSVPFIKGDDHGELVTEVIRALSSSGLATVVASGGMYTLNIEVLGGGTQKIGFRIDPQYVDGKVRNNLLSTEERKTLSVEVTLCEGAEIAFGPYKLQADADYDFVDGDSIRDLTFNDLTGKTVTVLPFSLGQLEPLDSAQEAVKRPLYRKLAQKIVDQIAAAW